MSGRRRNADDDRWWRSGAGAIAAVLGAVAAFALTLGGPAWLKVVAAGFAVVGALMALLVHAAERPGRNREPDGKPALPRGSGILAAVVAACLMIVVVAGLRGYLTRQGSTQQPSAAHERARPSGPRPTESYAQEFVGIRDSLTAARRRWLPRLAASHTPEQRADAAQRLSGAYDRAVEAGRGLRVPPADAPAKKRILDAAADARDAYAAMARAAREPRDMSYLRARVRSRQAEKRLLDGIRALRPSARRSN